ncbi:MAG TPA: hypothetical protein VFJ15_14890 [Oleiagrimonas sp.]|nr:hypothetical protein [Oleiagrimonas sp.]
MLSLLEAVARGEIKITPLQLRAAIAALPYTHPKADTGKKAERQKAAEAAVLRFPKPVPPKTR